MATQDSSRKLNPSYFKPTGKNGVRRYSVPTGSLSSVTIPPGVDFIYIRNEDSANKLGFNFNSDGSGHYSILNPGEQTPVIRVTDDTVLNAQGIGGTTDAVIVGWGK